MKPYQKLKTPPGLILLSHFFIEDTGKPETRTEFYIFRAMEDAPMDFYVKKGDIITAQAHIQDNYNEVNWTSDQGNFWRWFNHVHLRQRNKYEILLEP